MHKKLLSIIIPAYNAHGHIKNCLDSIYRQLECIKSYEVIISDDNSKSGYDNLTERYEHLKIIRNTHNEGAGVARQLALDIAWGKWICFVDADDTLCDNPFEILNTINDRWQIICHEVKSENIPVIENTVLHGKIYRKEFLDKYIIKFDRYLRICEDSYFNIIAYKYAGSNILHTNKYHYVLTHNIKSTTNRFTNKKTLFPVYGIDYWDTLLQNGHMKLFNTDEIVSNITDIANNINEIDNIQIKYGIFYRLFSLCEKYKISIDIKSVYHSINLNQFYQKYKEERKRKILLSIVIPVYNSAKYLEKCLTNLFVVLGKFEKYTEVLCVDDYSTDAGEYQYIFHKFMDKTNLKFYSYKKNVRMGCNRNRGIALAHGEWITFLDHDDCFLDDTFDNFFITAKNFKDAKIIRGTPMIPYRDVKVPCFTMELIHGIFYRRNFLIKHHIKFTSRIDTSEDVYFNRLAFFTAQNNYGFHSIVTTKKIKYFYTENMNSTMHKLYNQRLYFEEFLLEYVNAVLMPTYEVAGMTDNDKKIILADLILVLDEQIKGYEKNSKNFKYFNLKILCALFLILQNEFEINFKHWYKFITNNKGIFHAICYKRYGKDYTRNPENKLSYLSLCTKMIDSMEEAEKEYLITLCKRGRKEAGKYVQGNSNR